MVGSCCHLRPAMMPASWRQGASRATKAHPGKGNGQGPGLLSLVPPQEKALLGLYPHGQSEIRD